MKGTGRVLRAELYRLLRSRMVWGSGLFVAAVSVLRVVLQRVAEAADHAAAVQRALGRGDEAPVAPGPGNAYAPFVDGWLAGLVVGTLLLLIFAALAIARDRESGVARLASTRSASRGGLVLGRALLGVPLVLGLMVVSGLAAGATAASLFAFGPLVEHGYTLATSAELQHELLRASLATLPPLLATWCFGLAISACFRSPVTAVGAALAAFLGFDLFEDVLGDAQRWVFASFNPSFVDTSCMHEMAGVARGLSDAGYNAATYAMNLILPWPEALVLVALAWWATRRRAL